jgi:TPR repeat protein
MYVGGQGVPRDYAQAVVWLRKAAEQGNALGQINLGTTYERGQGVPQDYAQAHMWYNLAASHAEDPATREMAVKNRDDVATKMTPAQIAEAQRLASEWKPTK